MLFVQIELYDKIIIIGCIYTKPIIRNVFENDFSDVESLIDKYPTSIFLLFGDFNLPSANNCSIVAFFLITSYYI